MHFLDIAIDLKTLRPSCYGLPFLFWGIDFAERRRTFASSICFLVALTTQEDFALVVGSIGAALFLVAYWNPEAALKPMKNVLHAGLWDCSFFPLPGCYWPYWSSYRHSGVEMRFITAAISATLATVLAICFERHCDRLAKCYHSFLV
jgi:hypothetical protein